MKLIPIVTMAFGLLCFTGILLACEYTPPEQIVPAKELIERSKTIVLASVSKAVYNDKTGFVTYTFSTMKALKGSLEKAFTITGYPMMWEGELRIFDHHVDEDFWKDNSGRSQHATDCIIHPSFTVGASYLIFPDKPYHRKSFELIIRTHGKEGKRDKWLSWVEAKTKAEQDGGGVSDK